METKTTFKKCETCEKHWFNGIGIEMCDKDWNCIYDVQSQTIQTITWHPYPKEKPPKTGYYIVSASNYMDGKDPYVDIWQFCKSEMFIKVGYIGIPESHVVAWAEMPKPYEG